MLTGEKILGELFDINEKIGSALSGIESLKEMHKERAARFDKLEERTSSLEKKQWFAAGKQSMLGAIAGAASAFLISYFKGHFS